MVYKNFYIARNNIIKFCKEMSQINANHTLGCEERNTIDQMETLLINKLHIINVCINTKLISHTTILIETGISRERTG